MKLFGSASPLVRIFSLLAAAALLTACNSESAPESKSEPKSEPSAKAANAKPSAAAKAAAAANDATAKMARAVGNGKPGAAVDIRYDIRTRPEAGTPVEVEVALVPGPGVDSMEATFAGMDGITLAGPLSASFPTVKAGEPYKHTLSLLPDRNGVFYITVAVNTQMGNTSLGRTFSIPFVVGKTPVQAKPTPAKDAKGEAIQPMPAEETSG
jgi:hypothetical protein